MRKGIQKIEQFLEWGGTKKDITLLVISGLSLLISILVPVTLPFDTAWVAIVLCGIPIILEAPVSYTHLDVYKRQVLQSITWLFSSFFKSRAEIPPLMAAAVATFIKAGIWMVP